MPGKWDQWAVKKGFISFLDYRNHCARKRGFVSNTAYRNDWERKKGFASHTSYQYDWSKKNGFASHTSYQNDWARKKGFASHYAYATDLAKKKGFASHRKYLDDWSQRHGYSSVRHYQESIRLEAKGAKFYAIGVRKEGYVWHHFQRGLVIAVPKELHIIPHKVLGKILNDVDVNCAVSLWASGMSVSDSLNAVLHNDISSGSEQLSENIGVEKVEH